MKETITIVTEVEIEYAGEFTRNQAVNYATSKVNINQLYTTTKGRCSARSSSSSEFAGLRPMSEAPLDGTPVLLKLGSEADGTLEFISGSFRNRGFDDAEWIDSRSMRCWPVAWMPLPRCDPIA